MKSVRLQDGDRFSSSNLYQPAAFSVLRLTLSQFMNRTNHYVFPVSLLAHLPVVGAMRQGRGHSPTNAAHIRELGTCVQSAKEWVCAAHQARLT
ncbi:hypothetical protein PGTUg99_031861 [Puccinia graminis f. sp. tritici]|uniref:Uncharacterized protein n=1 Tax=Puccinia graminis f. sp. tritici TaxID=56615 RepID=A0A5B0S7U3_PUCGR|nr:hypothetical protein PGTUg99_031861 [Puccinia graminis f. sp. tritici]